MAISNPDHPNPSGSSKANCENSFIPPSTAMNYRKILPKNCYIRSLVDWDNFPKETTTVPPWTLSHTA